MPALRLLALLALLYSAACEGLTEPDPPSLSVAPIDTTVDARTLFRLRVQLQGATPERGELPNFVSLQPEVATVDDGGFVIAYRPGTAAIVVTMRGAVDTARVHVLRTMDGLRPYAQTLHLSPGDSASVSATMVDTDGVPMPDVAVTWKSQDPEIATVTAAGEVRAVSYGWVMLLGEAEGFVTAADVGVFPRRSGACETEKPLRLDVGEVRSLSGTESHRLCFDGEYGGHLIVATLDGPPGASANLDVMVPWIPAPGMDQAAAARPLTREASRSARSSRNVAWARQPRRDTDFEERLRRRERSDLQPSGHLGTRSRGLRLSLSAAAEPSVGELLALRAPTSCSDFSERTARVAAVGRHALIVTDTTNPAGGLTDGGYRQVLAAFDSLLYPLATETFGDPSDIDENGRVLLFFTRAVNELTPADTGAYVGGFHYAGDLFPRAECAGSNQAEILYLLAPDPAGSINGQRWSEESIVGVTPETVVHEMQHLINASRRLYVNGATEWETVWLNEGLSHVAEELAFYRASGISPGSNLNSGMIIGDPVRLRAFSLYGSANLVRYAYLLDALADQSPFQNDDDLETRGAIWSFLRYAADQGSRPERQLWFDLVNSRRSGTANLVETLGTDPGALHRKWLVSILMDDRTPFVPMEDVFLQPSWNTRELLNRMGLVPHPPEVWAVPGVRPIAIAAHSMAVVEFGARGEVRFEAAGSTPPPEGFRLEVVRIY